MLKAAHEFKPKRGQSTYSKSSEIYFFGNTQISEIKPDGTLYPMEGEPMQINPVVRIVEVYKAEWWVLAQDNERNAHIFCQPAKTEKLAIHLAMQAQGDDLKYSMALPTGKAQKVLWLGKRIPYELAITLFQRHQVPLPKILDYQFAVITPESKWGDISKYIGELPALEAWYDNHQKHWFFNTVNVERRKGM